jgi:hypothetical protein
MPEGDFMVSIQERANTFLDVLDRPIPKFLLWCWGILAAWDTFVSQFIPEETAKSFPKAHQVIAMTYGWLSIQTWLLIGAGILVLTSLEYAARHRWRLESVTGDGGRAPKRDGARPILVVFWLVVSALIVIIWSLDAAHWTSRKDQEIAMPSPITSPSPTPTAPTPAPTPKGPWVDEEEFQTAKKAGRLLLPFTPEELANANYSGGGVATDAYVGRWVVTVIQSGWPNYLIFDSKKWGERILVMRRGVAVKALCQLVKYDKEAYDASAAKFIGQNCELL